MRWVARGFKVALFGALAITVFGEVVQQLWNWLIPAIFGLHAISFGQALGLLALSWILFGGLRGRSRGYGGPWARGMRARWEQMTPEERETFRRGMRGRCGGGRREAAEPKPASA